MPGLSAPKLRANDNYHLNGSNEPNHPPRPYKVSCSVRSWPKFFSGKTIYIFITSNKLNVTLEISKVAYSVILTFNS